MLTEEEQSELLNHLMETQGLSAKVADPMTAFRVGMQAAIVGIADRVKMAQSPKKRKV